MISLVTKGTYVHEGSEVVDSSLTICWGWDKIKELGCHPTIVSILLGRPDKTEDIGSSYSFGSYPVTKPTTLTILGLDDNITEITIIAI